MMDVAPTYIRVWGLCVPCVVGVPRPVVAECVWFNVVILPTPQRRCLVLVGANMAVSKMSTLVAHPKTRFM